MVLGVTAMLDLLIGDSGENITKYYGRKITHVDFNEDRLKLSFEDGTTIELRDEGQCCCEERYITCDDDVTDLIGGKLVNIEAKNFKEKDYEYTTQELCFVDIQTDQICITLTTHNDHNGYYGGFVLKIREV